MAGRYKIDGDTVIFVDGGGIAVAVPYDENTRRHMRSLGLPLAPAKTWLPDVRPVEKWAWAKTVGKVFAFFGLVILAVVIGLFVTIAVGVAISLDFLFDPPPAKRKNPNSHQP